MPSVNQITVQIAQPLQLEPKKILGAMKVRIGDVIAQGDVLAESSSSLFGLKKLQVQSPVAGTVAQVDDVQGAVLINVTGEVFESVSSSNKQEAKQQEAETPTDIDSQESTQPKPDRDIPQKTTNEDTKTDEIQKPPVKTTGQEAEPTTQETPEKTFSRPSKQLGKLIEGTVHGTLGFGTAKGPALLVPQGELDAAITKAHMGHVLVVSTIPQLSALFKASTLGIEGMIIASDDATSCQHLQQELSGKAQLGCVCVPAQTDLTQFTDTQVVLKGEERIIELI